MTTTTTTTSQEGGGLAKVLSKLEKAVEEGSYYEAQQMYKTIYFRYSGQKKFEEVKQLLIQGACSMLTHGHINEGTDLALLLITTYTDTKTLVDKQSLDPVYRILSLYKEKHAGRDSFIKAAIKWTSTEGLASNKQGDPLLHTMAADIYAKEQDYGRASKHFLYSNNPERFAEMLIVYAKEVYPSERDLILCRAVLQYLCLSNLKDANVLYKQFLSLYSNFPQTPLINFLRFLLMTMEHEAYPVFDMLRKRYKPSLDRDPSFEQYMDMIAQIFYKVRPQAQNSGGFGNLIGDLMRSLMQPTTQ